MVAYTRCDFDSDEFKTLDEYLTHLEMKENQYRLAFKEKLKHDIQVLGFGLRKNKNG